MAKKRKLKFGSPAWRKKYAAKAKRNRASTARRSNGKTKGLFGAAEQRRWIAAENRRYKAEQKRKEKADKAARKASFKSAKRKNRSGIYIPPIKSRSTARSGRRNSPNKKRATKRRTLPVRNNPPRKWTKVKSVRVIRKGGRDVLEIRK